MIIDKESGKILLPNDLEITTDLTKSMFEISPFFSQASPYDHGTLPFQWYRLEGGELDGHMLNLRVCFYEEELVLFSASANHYPTLSPGWDDFSLDIESRAKQFHDELLHETLGEPHEKLPGDPGTGYASLGFTSKYTYPWGAVWSSYDSRAGSSSIVIRYGSRLEEAQKDYSLRFQK